MLFAFGNPLLAVILSNLTASLDRPHWPAPLGNSNMNINLTLIAQAISFAVFILFTVKFVWPR